jgi:hypothetical protein
MLKVMGVNDYSKLPHLSGWQVDKERTLFVFFFGGILAENLMILSESGILLKQKLEKKGDNCEWYSDFMFFLPWADQAP